MKLPRKAVLIRLAIYVPLLGFFGWRALAAYQAEKDAKLQQQQQADQVELADPFSGEPTKTIDVDGKKVKVYEISPEEAEQYFGVQPGAAAAAAGAEGPAPAESGEAPEGAEGEPAQPAPAEPPAQPEEKAPADG